MTWKHELYNNVQLAFWLQVLVQCCTSIAAVVVYSGIIFRNPGFDGLESDWLSALDNMVGILETNIAALTLVCVGRRRTLY